MKEMSMLGIVF